MSMVTSWSKPSSPPTLKEWPPRWLPTPTHPPPLTPEYSPIIARAVLSKVKSELVAPLLKTFHGPSPCGTKERLFEGLHLPHSEVFGILVFDFFLNFILLTWKWTLEYYKELPRGPHRPWQCLAFLRHPARQSNQPPPWALEDSLHQAGVLTLPVPAPPLQATANIGGDSKGTLSFSICCRWQNAQDQPSTGITGRYSGLKRHLEKKGSMEIPTGISSYPLK